MFSKPKQRKYFRERWDGFIVHFDRFEKRTNATDLHAMRVELKKIRALIYIHEHINGQLPKSQTRITEKIFKQAGIVRDAQVSTQLVRSKKGIPTEFFTEQRQTVAREAWRFVHLVNENADEIITANTKVWKSLKDLSKRKTGKLLGEMLQEVRDVFYPRLDIEALHHVRMKIKRLIYIGGMVKNNGVIDGNTNDLKRLEELIGQWHDTEITEDLIEEYIPKSVSVRKLKIQRARLLRSIRKQAAFLNQ